MSNANIIDKPRQENENDLLGIDKYTEALVQFIGKAQMPTTLAIQGEWGSGKTSLLNQLRYRLCEQEHNSLEENKKLPFYSIWVNTWQYSMMKTREETLIAIMSGLTNEITRILKQKHETKTKAAISKVTNLFSKIAKAGAKIAANAIHDGAGDLIDQLSGDENEVTLLQFRNALQEAIKLCLVADKEQGNNNRGFIFFIDDLDRIDPPVAVEILELLKNIFEVDNCLFVLAIDYEVVVKGLVPKFGPLTDKNEREFRSFFDKIIQLPFSMPLANYDVAKFLMNSLHDVGYIDERFENDTTLKDKVSDLALLSVGTNPRSLKRLINTLSLLNIIGSLEQENKQRPIHELLINFGLVCIQIAYPKIYAALLEEPDYKEWSEQTAKKMRLADISESQQAVLNGTSEFDEMWEKVLFRICQKDSYLASRAFHISQLLNYMIELVPDNLVFGDEISRILGFSAVTSVNLDFVQKPNKGGKVRYEGWDGFNKVMQEAIKKGSLNWTPTITEALKHIHDDLDVTLKDLIQINYTPNFVTFACKHPAARSKTFLYIRLKKINLLLEFVGGPAVINQQSDYTAELKSKLLEAFNNLSTTKINSGSLKPLILQ